MIVVDTNVIASLYLRTSQTARAERALEKDPEWAAPLLWRSELRNVLAPLERSGRLDLAAAVDIMRAAEDLLAGREFAVPSSNVLAAAARSGCTAYDCELAVLAEGLGVPLVSLDRGLLREFPGAAVSLADFAN